ncbi:MAG: MFS transporter [Pseudonocardia sp.]|uniref:MFS transporter n=1 Tax=unclassified Pseudonocardia TaxID=2619320 RepID=UPI00086C06EB|nr:MULTISPECIES: MFS transporter [unclassified Pseudonocardia]MBN9109859.1 MFS transporter [Pseudonocardia sp.]ODV03236.1 MAG: MFS transporter [Pseudonocardia sp. SCN 73-27]
MSTEAVAPQQNAAGASAPPERGSGELSHKQIVTILVGLALGMFLAALDQTVVSTAIRTIADDLGGLSLQAWATTAFLITGTITTPLYGKLSDQFGRKPLFLFAISIFIVGSVLCTFSTSMYELAAFRAVQGLGAGGLFTLALTILGDIVPPRERARYQGYILAVFGTSSVIGPVIGGVLSGQATIAGIDGWRWIFLVNVPIGAVALFVVAKVLNLPHTKRSRRIDWPGAVALAIFLVPLLIIAEQGREWGWGSTSAIVCYIIGAVGFVLFLLAERLYGDDALVPLRLFRNNVFSLTGTAGFVIGMGMFGGIVLLPQFLQIVHGATPTESGFLMLPLVAGIMVASILSGQITSRTGHYKIFPIIGTALMVGAMMLLHFRVNVDIPLWELDLYMAMLGLGLGGCMQTLVLAVQNAVPARDMGVATASSTFFRQLGGTLGVAVFLSILFSTVTDKISEAFSRAQTDPTFMAAVADPAVRADPVNAPFFAALNGGADTSGVLNDSSFLQKIDPRLARPFLEGFSNSMTLTFLIVGLILVIAFVLVLFIKELPLRTMSGAQARAMEEAAGEGASVGAVTPTPLEAEAAPSSPLPRNGNGHIGNGNGAGVSAGTVAAAVAAAATGNGQGSRHALRDTSGAADPSVTAPMPVAASSGGPVDGPAIEGTVRRADGAGLAGAVVTVTEPTGRQAARTTSDQVGEYRIGVPTGGTYLVVAASGAFQPHAAMVAVADRAVRHDVTLAGAGGLRGVVRVTDAQGATRPVSGVAVTLIDVQGNVSAATVSDELGRYLLAGVPDGQYTLTAAGTGYQPVATSVVLPGGNEVVQDVELPRRARLLGTVVAGSTGRGVPEALATLIDPSGNVVGSTVTDADGTFAFDDLAEGTYTITASGYAPIASVVQVTAGGASTTEIAFAAPVVAGSAPSSPAVAAQEPTSLGAPPPDLPAVPEEPGSPTGGRLR